jgi:hypothetical protein
MCLGDLLVMSKNSRQKSRQVNLPVFPRAIEVFFHNKIKNVRFLDNLLPF